MMIDVALLGTGGTLPLPGRFLSSLLIRHSGVMTLIDCGEGTQVSLRELGWGIKDIGTILITHFHADHISGLPGLLLTIGNSGRTANEPLTMVGPRGLQRVVEHLRVIAPHLPYQIIFREMTGRGDEQLELNHGLRLKVQMGDHDIACLAYRFELDRAPQFQPERAKALEIPLQFWKSLQRGEPVIVGEKTFQPEQVLGPPRVGLSMAFVTDTRPTEKLAQFIEDVDLFICEASYGDPEDRVKAIENKHMTFGEAAMLASAGRAKQLWLTHFSPALPFPDRYRKEAAVIFPTVVLGEKHLNTTLKFIDA
jgi:ribonuclease Z